MKKRFGYVVHFRANPIAARPRPKSARVPGSGTDEMAPNDSDWTPSAPAPRSTTRLPIPAIAIGDSRTATKARYVVFVFVIGLRDSLYY